MPLKHIILKQDEVIDLPTDEYRIIKTKLDTSGNFHLLVSHEEWEKVSNIGEAIKKARSS